MTGSDNNEATGCGLVDLTGAPPPWDEGSLKHWTECLTRACAEPLAWHTPPPRGEPALREALACALRHDPAHLVITSGLRAWVRRSLGDRSRVHLETPSFADVARLAAWAGARVTRWNDVALANSGEVGVTAGDVVWLTHPARNPDGRTLVPWQRETIAAWGLRGARLLVNETYRWSDPRVERVPGALHLGSLSKLLGGGAKVGWLVDDRLEGRGPPPEGGPPRPWQRALARFISEGGLERRLTVHWRPADALADRLRAALRAATGTGPKAGSRRGHLVLIGDGPAASTSSRDLVTHLAKCGFAVSDGTAFGAASGTVRLSLGGLGADDYDRLERTLLKHTKVTEVLG